MDGSLRGDLRLLQYRSSRYNTPRRACLPRPILISSQAARGHLPYHSIDVFLLLWAAGAWAYFDKTYQGLVIAGAAAVGGPIIEIVLINVFHLYTYTNPDIFGIPSWIPWVYACGGPAVGNLSRTARGKLRAFLNLAGPVCRVPIYESRPSWRPPPRGFDRARFALPA